VAPRMLDIVFIEPGAEKMHVSKRRFRLELQGRHCHETSPRGHFLRGPHKVPAILVPMLIFNATNDEPATPRDWATTPESIGPSRQAALGQQCSPRCRTRAMSWVVLEQRVNEVYRRHGMALTHNTATMTMLSRTLSRKRGMG